MTLPYGTESESNLTYPKRIGFLGEGFINWTGGQEFLTGIILSILEVHPGGEYHLLIPKRKLRSSINDFKRRMEYFFLSKPRDRTQESISQLISNMISLGVSVHRVNSDSSSLATKVKELDLNAIIPAIDSRLSSSVPCVGYIYDLQHKRLPYFFTAEERNARDKVFTTMLNDMSAIIVNSRSVALDIKEFYPFHKAKIFIMPFAPIPSANAFLISKRDVRSRYNINGPFFIICNQFWMHKDHTTAFKAFARVADKFPLLSLVCTGDTTDYRHPNYFNELMKQIKEDQIDHRVRILGHISKADQLALMRASVSVIQPSLFEGGPGGGSIYDSVSIGHPSIVSDIQVNREIEDHTVSFFESGNVESLEYQMEKHIIEYKEKQSDVLTADMIAIGVEGRRALGNMALSALLFSLGNTDVRR